MDTSTIKEARFELVEIPEALGPLEVVVDDHKIKTFAFTQDDYGSWYLRKSPFGRRIGHAAILANDLLNAYYSKYVPAVGLHADEELWFESPVFLGERVVVSGSYVDKYVKRGKGYVVMESEARGEDGRLLCRHRGTEIMQIDPEIAVGGRSAEVPGKHVTGEVRADLRPVAEARLGLQPGTGIVPLVKRISQEQMSVYSYCGIYQRNIHNDLEIAHGAGLERPIMQGQQGACYIAELMTRFFGASWFTTGRERVKFLQPICPNELLTISGAVGEYLDDGSRLEVETWIKNEAGQLVTVGWASARVGA